MLIVIQFRCSFLGFHDITPSKIKHTFIRINYTLRHAHKHTHNYPPLPHFNQQQTIYSHILVQLTWVQKCVAIVNNNLISFEVKIITYTFFFSTIVVIVEKSFVMRVQTIQCHCRLLPNQFECVMTAMYSLWEDIPLCSELKKNTLSQF